MIRIRQLKLKIDHTEEDLKKKIQHTLHLKPGQCVSYIIRKQSLDARKKPDLFYTYTVDVEVSGEASILQKTRIKIFARLNGENTAIRRKVQNHYSIVRS